MAKVKLNAVVEQIRGQVGDLVFKRHGDEVVVARKPDTEGREWTEAQEAHRDRFRQAALYGKMVMADEAAKALYEKAAKGKPAFSLMVADFFNLPCVDEVDLSGYAGQAGDVIVIRAHDDFDVTGVALALTDGAGNAIESGAATETPPDSGRWTYAATTAVPTGTTVRIEVSASDRPGHKTTRTETRG